MKLATRLYLSVAALLAAACVVVSVAMRLDFAGLVLASLVLAAVLVALLPVTWLLTRGLVTRLSDARTALHRIAAGDLELAVGSPGRDEVSALARAIDRTADQLRAQADASGRESRDLRALFDELDDGLAFVDAEGVITLYNRAFERWAGRPIPSDARIGTLFRTPAVPDALLQALAGRNVVEEVGVGESTILLSARPHRSGAVIVLRDLTPMRRLEGIRRDFVANVSHELKTPLTSVVGFAEALSDADLDSDRSRDFASRILANATRMRRLVDDLLDLSLVESGSWSPALEPIALGPLASDVWEGLPPEVRAPSVTLEVIQEAGEALVDADAARHILRNLLDNAARYAPAGTAIEVRVGSHDGEVRTEVRDHGPGIPSAHVERVFERFYRADPARSRDRGGTGLGLAIVKHFVEAHGGDLGIESEVGRGTTVWFTLPAAGTPPPERPGREA